MMLSTTVKQIIIKAPIALVVLAALYSSGCGKRKPPVPPRERVQQRAVLEGFQRGNQVILSWKMPARNAEPTSVLNISRIDIYRFAQPQAAPLILTEEEFASAATLIATVPVTKADFGAKTLQYKDTLQFAAQPARLRYAIRYVNASGQKAAFSNALLIEPAGKVASNPTDLAATVTQDAVKLTWEPPAQNIDSSGPASIIGYNIYRATSETQPARLLNTSPVTSTSFDDELFEFDKNYWYFVRAVSVGLAAEPVESTESNIIRLRAKDTFPPSAPTAITLAAAPNVISIFFAINPEKDIAGYKIYRSEDRDAPLDKWQLITAELINTTTFQDNRVETGKAYHYYITATDTAGNVSEPSEVVTETAP